jgi:hypothetical protein
MQVHEGSACNFGPSYCRIPDKIKLIAEIAARRNNHNKHHAKADWQFTTNDARVKLRRLNPRFE